MSLSNRRSLLDGVAMSVWLVAWGVLIFFVATALSDYGARARGFYAQGEAESAEVGK